jgi:hypothetical protein
VSELRKALGLSDKKFKTKNIRFGSDSYEVIQNPDEMFFEVADGFDCSDSGAEWDRILYFTRFMGVSVSEWFQMPVRRQRKFLVAFNYHIEKHPLSTL